MLLSHPLRSRLVIGVSSKRNKHDPVTSVCLSDFSLTNEQAEADEVRRMAEEERQQWAMSIGDRRIYDNVRY